MHKVYAQFYRVVYNDGVHAGLNGTMVLPELAGRILKFVDGHRSVLMHTC